MIGLVMAGGKGTRMNLDTEKLLLKYKKPIILHVLDSLKNSNCFSKILAVTSTNSPKTNQLLEENNVEIFHSSGNGYVEDLNSALSTIDNHVLVTSGDLPLLDNEIIKNIVNQFNPEMIWTSILVTKNFLNTINLESEYSILFEGQICHYTGISLVNAKNISSLEHVIENYIIIDDKRVAFNLNSKDDYDLLGTA